MHRVRVGLIGLCSVFLLVMLAAAVFRVTTEAPKADNSTAMTNSEAPAEPLAQLGVVPGYTPVEENVFRVAPPPTAPAHK